MFAANVGSFGLRHRFFYWRNYKGETSVNGGINVNRRRALLAMSVVSVQLLCLSAASAETIAPRPYRVVWPTGWEVSYLPSPATNSGKNLGGERARVLLKGVGGAFVAAIELTHLPRSDKGRANLTEEFDLLRANLKAGYERQKFQVKLTPTQEQAIGGLPALTTELSVTNDNTHLMQWMAVALSPQFFYALTFTARAENFVRYRPQFDAVKQAIALK